MRASAAARAGRGEAGRATPRYRSSPDSEKRDRPFGYVIRALADRDRSLTELAGLLGVSKQAAIKVVDEMEARGFLGRHVDSSDRRVKVLRLTEKGIAVRRAALAASRAMERELRRELGDSDVNALRHALAELLARHGVLDDARAGSSRALW